MKKNLQNFSLLMLLATASAAQLSAMHEHVDFDLQGRDSKAEFNKQNAAQGPSAAEKTQSIAERAQDAYNNAKMPNLGIRNAANKAGTALANATGYQSEANANGWTFNSAANKVKNDAVDFSNSFQDNLAEQMGQGGNGYQAPTTISGRISQAGKTAYNAPGALVETLGGKGDFITGETGSLKSAANATGRAVSNAPSNLASAGRATGRAVYNAPRRMLDATNTAIGDMAIAGTKAYNAPGKLRQNIRDSAKNTTKKQFYNKFSGDKLNITMSESAVKALDSVLTSVEKLPNTIAGKLSSAKQTASGWFTASGKQLNEVSPRDLIAAKEIVNEEASTGANPTAVAQSTWSRLTAYFTKSKTAPVAEATPLIDVSSSNDLVTSEGDVYNPMISNGFNDTAVIPFTN